MSELSTCNDLIIYPTDKNLGPSVAARNNYIPNVLQEHLLNPENYEFLPLETAHSKIRKQRQNFVHLYAKHHRSLISEAEVVYFKRATSDTHLAKTQVPHFMELTKSIKLAVGQDQ